MRENPVNEYYYQQLLEKYPNKEVKGLYGNHPELWKKINAHCKTIGIKKDEYITSLDFIYGKKARITKKNRDELLIDQLLEAYPDKVIIGLPTGYPNIYAKVDNYARQNNISQEEYLTTLGFDYTTNAYLRPNRNSNSNSNLLKELENIQGKLERATDENTKRRRSKALVETLKKLYSYNCQLCNESSSNPVIPRIEMDNGNYYVEVHHIQPISTVDDTNDDSKKLLDTYRNVIVVCSHHHKVLHYEKGGYHRLTKHDGKIQFVSGKEKLLPIHTNLHLKV